MKDLPIRAVALPAAPVPRFAALSNGSPQHLCSSSRQGLTVVEFVNHPL
jgi:hypothetical protein